MRELRKRTNHINHTILLYIMKRNIKIINTVLHICIVCLAVYTLYIAASLFITIKINDIGETESLIKNFFPGSNNFVEDRKRPGLTIFLAIYSCLLIYLLRAIYIFKKTLRSIIVNEAFQKNQSDGFRAVASGIIIFAKLRYLLFVSVGPIFFMDIFVFFTEIIPYITLYILGKFLHVIADMTKKGEILLEENELTV